MSTESVSLLQDATEVDNDDFAGDEGLVRVRDRLEDDRYFFHCVVAREDEETVKYWTKCLAGAVGSKNDTDKILLNKAAATPDGWGALPFHIALARTGEGRLRGERLSLKTIKDIVYLYPEAVNCICEKSFLDRWFLGSSCEIYPLNMAVLAGHGITVIDFLISMQSKTMEIFDIPYHAELDNAMAKGIDLALPYVKKIQLGASEWTAEAFDCVLQSLEKHKLEKTPLRSVELSLPSFLMEEDTEQDNALFSFLGGTDSAITEVAIDCYAAVTEPEEPHDNILASLKANLRSNQSLQVLTLSHLHCPDNQSFRDFLLSDLPPKKVVLDDCYTPHEGLATSVIDSSNCRIEHLELTGAESADWLIKIPKLSCLSLMPRDLFEDVDQVVLALLKCNQISDLHLRRCILNWELFLDALRTNTSLQRFTVSCVYFDAHGEQQSLERRDQFVKVLKHDNLTLMEFSEEGRSLMSSSSISYYVLLNKYGRAKLRGTNSISELIQALAAVPQAKFADETLTGLLYGLLREAPGLLSSVVPIGGLKRKLDSMD